MVILFLFLQYDYHWHNTPQITTRTTMIYGSYGNIVKTFNEGDITRSDDDVITEITYHQDINSKNMLGIPSEVQVKDGGGGLLRRRTSTIDYNTGHTTSVTLYKGA